MDLILKTLGRLQKEMLPSRASSSDQPSFGEIAFPLTKERLDKVEQVNFMSALGYILLYLVNVKYSSACLG
jgi:hypothetical protein